MKRQQLSLVLPCYKPEPAWLEKILVYYSNISERLPSTELFLVIVNDGSPDMISAEHLKGLKDKINNFSYYSYDKNKGKGYALRFGVERTTTSSVIYSDLDLPYTPDSFLEIVDLLSTHDVVIGIKDSDYYNNVPVWRKRISRLLQYMIALFFPGIVTTDTQCGLKGIKGDGKEIFLQTKTNGYLFDMEFVIRVSQVNKVKVITKEIVLRDDVKFGKLSVSTVFHETLSFFKIFVLRTKSKF